MNIGLEHQIVIVDEAHNIEDSSRDSASWSVTPQSLEEAMIDLDYLGMYVIFLPVFTKEKTILTGPLGRTINN